MTANSGRPVPHTAEQVLRDLDRRITQQERRPIISRASDIMGPGLGPRSVQIQDWNGPETEFNGFYFSAPGADNSPDPALWWMGTVMVQIEGFGIMEVWDYRGTSVPILRMARRFSTGSGVRTFSAWG